ncbi:MAG: hypothetical protein WBG57_10825 [Ornithinimicrobium sp.]
MSPRSAIEGMEMSEVIGLGLIDEATKLRLAALNLTATLRPVQANAVGIRSQWLRLGAAYETPETDVLIRKMDGPAREAGLLSDAAFTAQAALLEYADRLVELARWPVTTAWEVTALQQACAAAEGACGAALQAIPRPPHRSATTPGGCLPSPAASTVIQQHVPPVQPGPLRESPDKSRPAASPWSLPGLVDHWAGLAPPETNDPAAHALYSFSVVGLAAETQAGWMITVKHGAFRPRGHGGRYVSVSSLSRTERFVAGAGSLSTTRGLTRAQRLATFTPGGTFEAKSHRGAVRAQWSSQATQWGRANAAVTVASSGVDAWQENAGYATAQRIGRTVTQGTAVAGGALAGGQAGALVGSAVGTAILPGAGTVVGATVGGLIGGFAGSEVGARVGDQMVDVGGEAGDLIGDSLGWVGDQAQDVGGSLLDVATFWD